MRIRGDAWSPLVVETFSNTLQATPEVVRQVCFSPETRQFKIDDIGGSLHRPLRRPGWYLVEKATGAGFVVYFNGYRTTSEVTNPAQDIVQPLVRLLLSLCP
jgi:hypothetical protein